MAQVYRVSLILEPQPEGGYTVTAPGLPGLVTEGDSVDAAVENARDALLATIELYEESGRPLPADILQETEAGSLQFDLLVPAS